MRTCGMDIYRRLTNKGASNAVPGNVEEDGLEEKGEADPLVVLVVLPPAPVCRGWGYASMGHVMTNLTLHLINIS